MLLPSPPKNTVLAPPAVSLVHHGQNIAVGHGIYPLMVTPRIHVDSLPTCSMYGILTYMWVILRVHVNKHIPYVEYLGHADIPRRVDDRIFDHKNTIKIPIKYSSLGTVLAKTGYPNEWLCLKSGNPKKHGFQNQDDLSLDDLRVPPFQETHVYVYIHMYIYI